MKKWNLLALVFVLSALLCLADNGVAYSGGMMIDLGTLPGVKFSYAYGINNIGQIVGHSGENAHYHAFLYSNGVMTDLGTLEEPYNYVSEAKGINNNGQVVGLSYKGDGVGFRAFLYSNGVMTDLGTLPGGTNSEARGINDSGQIVGSANIASGKYHAFLYSNGVMIDLGTLPGGTESWGTGINNNGQIVGAATTASGQTHAFLYSNGVMMDLGTLPGGTNSEARGINDSGQIVGSSWTTTSGQPHGFLYSRGKMTDLGTLGGTQSYAHAINNNGQIVGQANIVSNYTHAFLYPTTVLSVNPASLSPFCMRGHNADSQSFTVQNTGDGTLSYTISDNAAWLSVTPTNGISTGEQGIITVNYATSGLPPGKYNATITISAQGAIGTPQTIAVNLAVKAPSMPHVLLILLD